MLVDQEMSDVFVVEMWDIKPTINDAQQEENSAGSVMEQGILTKCVKRSRNKTLGEAQEAQADHIGEGEVVHATMQGK